MKKKCGSSSSDFKINAARLSWLQDNNEMVKNVTKIEWVKETLFKNLINIFICSETFTHYRLSFDAVLGTCYLSLSVGSVLVQ